MMLSPGGRSYCQVRELDHDHEVLSGYCPAVLDRYGSAIIECDERGRYQLYSTMPYPIMRTFSADT